MVLSQNAMSQAAAACPSSDSIRILGFPQSVSTFVATEAQAINRAAEAAERMADEACKMTADIKGSAGGGVPAVRTAAAAGAAPVQAPPAGAGRRGSRKQRPLGLSSLTGGPRRVEGSPAAGQGIQLQNRASQLQCAAAQPQEGCRAVAVCLACLPLAGLVSPPALLTTCAVLKDPLPRMRLQTRTWSCSSG